MSFKVTKCENIESFMKICNDLRDLGQDGKEHLIIETDLDKLKLPYGAYVSVKDGYDHSKTGQLTTRAKLNGIDRLLTWFFGKTEATQINVVADFAIRFFEENREFLSTPGAKDVLLNLQSRLGKSLKDSALKQRLDRAVQNLLFQAAHPDQVTGGFVGAKLRKDRASADVTLICKGGIEIKAHQVMLRQVDLFKRFFSAPGFKVDKDESIDIQQFSSQTIQRLLDILYGVEPTFVLAENSFQELLVVVDFFGLDALKQHMELHPEKTSNGLISVTIPPECPVFENRDRNDPTSDVILTCKDGLEVRAHKLMLTHAGIALDSDLTAYPSEAVEALLDLLYQGRTDASWEQLLWVCRMADTLGLLEIRERCQADLKRRFIDNGDLQAEAFLYFYKEMKPQRNNPDGQDPLERFLRSQMNVYMEGFLQKTLRETLIPQEKRKEIFDLCQEGAEKDDLILRHQLGNCYRFGYGTEKDIGKAITCFERGADQSDVDSRLGLGACYLMEGEHKDYEAAAFQFIAAEARGSLAATYQMGHCFLQGRGVPKDETQAFKCFLRAAEQGYALAQVAVAICYEDGRGIKKDPAKTFYWSQKAADQGDPTGKVTLGNCLAGKGVKKDYLEAIRLYRYAADRGYARGTLGVGLAMHGINPKNKASFSWIKKSAEQGLVHAKRNVGVCYTNGDNVDQDFAQAFKWVEKASDEGFILARANLAGLYYYGWGVARDYQLALQNATQAVEMATADDSLWRFSETLELCQNRLTFIANNPF